jgi:hypothetical protein
LGWDRFGCLGGEGGGGGIKLTLFFYKTSIFLITNLEDIFISNVFMKN